MPAIHLHENGGNGSFTNTPAAALTIDASLDLVAMFSRVTYSSRVMQKWEYKVSERMELIGMMGGVKSKSQEHLDEMSAEGWELVSTGVATQGVAWTACYFWKRPTEGS